MPSEARTVDQALELLKAHGSADNRAGMKRFGIETAQAYGVPMPEIRAIARETTKDHELAAQLWQTGIHEARILAGLVDLPGQVSSEQMDQWVGDFNSWDLCDQVCGNLFDRTALVHEKIMQWARDDRQFVRRAAFAMIAWRAVHDKRASDDVFLGYLGLVDQIASDPRNFVKKAVNWALRQIGKRSVNLHGPSLALARNLAANPDRTRAWIGKDAAKELDGDTVRQRLGV